MNLHFDVTLISCQTQFHMHRLEDDSECTVAVVWERSRGPTASRFRRRQNWSVYTAVYTTVSSLGAAGNG